MLTPSRRVLLVAAAILALAGPAAADCTGISPSAGSTVTSVAVVTGMTGRPLLVTAPPLDRDRIFIVEQSGFIRIHQRGAGSATTTLFLDLSGKVQAAPSINEMGLLGLAFDPNYATNGRFYVNYTEGPVLGPWFTVVARYNVSAGDPDSADPGSEQRLLRFSQPENNHNGGMLVFGPDHFLYVATGDGGGGGDVHGTCGNGQNKSTMLGKLLRLDVTGAAPSTLPPDCGGASAGYLIPSTNPLADGAGGVCDEIFDFGLRNPWRLSFDRSTGDLYVADVGQNCWEEVNVSPGNAGGVNYGWRQMEATHCFKAPPPIVCDPAPVACGTSPACHDPSITLPVVEYGHSGGACSITGGYVYEGCLLPLLHRRYFYGDFCAGFVRSFIFQGGAATEPLDFTAALDPSGGLVNGLTSFGEDAEGELYIVDRSGTILKVVPPLTALEVSGPGAADQLTLQPGPWTWENLGRTTGHPINQYRVFRGQPGGSFQCVLGTAGTSWTSGDPATPAAGAMFAYIVTAVNASGQQTLTGTPARTLLPNACP